MCVRIIICYIKKYLYLCIIYVLSSVSITVCDAAGYAVVRVTVAAAKRPDAPPLGRQKRGGQMIELLKKDE